MSGNIVISILVVIVMLGLMVTVHELGHYFIARLLGINAYEVSIFLGPKLIHWKNKAGVEFTIRAIPFGAYVRFSDIDDDGYIVEHPDNEKELLNQPRFKRLLVALAGPAMNVLLSFVMFIALFAIIGVPTLELDKADEGSPLASSSYTEGDRLCDINGHSLFTPYDFNFYLNLNYEEDKPTTLGLISQKDNKRYEITLDPVFMDTRTLGITFDGRKKGPDGGYMLEIVDSKATYSPELKSGDYLKKIDGVEVTYEAFADIRESYQDKDSVVMLVSRDGKDIEVTCTPEVKKVPVYPGMELKTYQVDSFANFLKACRYTVRMPVSIAMLSVKTVQAAFDQKVEAYNVVSGPVGFTENVTAIVDSSLSVKGKALELLQISAIISMGLAFTNMLPIPGLDVNQLLLLVIEMVTGKKLSEKAEKGLTVVGFACLIVLFLFALSSDIIRIIVEHT